MITTADIISKVRGNIKDLEVLSRDAFQYDTDPSFTLSKDYVSATGMKIYKNGTLLVETTDWTYNIITNKVTIIASLTNGDAIIINYNCYEKYSDSEITAYIKSNLAWFVKRRYKKVFYMNSDNEVVALNNINPTEEEATIIASITAIDISPNNFRVQIVGGFTIDAEENKSKTELINDVFDQFLKSWGSIDFLEK